MKQVLQSLKTGAIEVAEVPRPAVGRGQLLVRTRRSLISTGTERMLVEFGRAGWWDKARQQPEKVRQVLEKARTDGLWATLEAVQRKLDQPLPLGYSNVGVVEEVGAGVEGFAVGDRVVSNGRHAEVVAVPATLAARVPPGVSDDAAAFAVVGAIALQGVRLLAPTLGEGMVVLGLGLLGQLAVQLLRAHGCRVLGVDPDPARRALAERFGAEVAAPEAALEAAARLSRGRGVDGVLVAAATSSSEPIHQAAQMCRKRGRIVLVGVTGLALRRSDFYEKELTFQVSCSYGPGRYDPLYEVKGQDYPFGFVRWTAQRNMEAVLDLLAEGRLEVDPLVSHRFPLDEAPRAYEVVLGAEPSLGILLEYAASAPAAGPEARTVAVQPAPTTAGDRPGVGVLGAGNYATAALLPALRAGGVRLRCVVSSSGATGLHAARRFGFEETSTDPERVFADPATNAVVVATRHDSHARYVLRALETGKHVFCEKPLCLTLDELGRIESLYRQRAAEGRAPVLMVGFNRRFAPLVTTMRRLLDGVGGPKALVITVNAGAVPLDHWTQDPEVGGGRILGEACHFVDLARFLVGAPIARWGRWSLPTPARDCATLQLAFADGSTAAIHYLANGHRGFPKERVEAFVGGRVLQLDNFRVLRGWGWPGVRRRRLWRQDKGQRAAVAAFLSALRTGRAPIPFDEIVEVHRVTIELAQAP